MTKPRLSFWQIWNMSFGFLGIQFGLALQNANVSRIFETLGAKMDDIPILWIAAPVTGLIVQPIIGHMSDKTWGRLGRRKPYFLTGAILASLALLIMPNSPALWVAAGMLWILDASINISMEPFRALVADMLPSEQRTIGFAVQSFFIGLGSVVASALPYILTNLMGIANTAPEGEIPKSVMYSFYIGAVVFISAIIWTIVKTKEYPPNDLEEFKKNKADKSGLLKGIKEISSSFIHMPKTMVQLAFVQFFTWTSLFAMWVYNVPAVTRHIYGTADKNSALYNEGANWAGVLFSFYNLFAVVFAFALPWMAKRLSRKSVHMICLIVGGLSFISFYFIKNPDLLILSEVGIGLAWASILSMPYAILAGSLPPAKTGIYMGIFNFFIVIPQIFVAAILGFTIKNFFNNEAIYAYVLGGISLIIAGIMVLFVDDKD